MTVAVILKSKGSDVYTIAPDKSILEAARMLCERRIGALVVSGDGVTVSGIISERDIVRGLGEQGGDVLGRPVRDVMTADVITCTHDDSSSDLLERMTDRRIRHLPVVDSGRLAGMISIGDVVKHRLDAVTAEAEAMRDYIAHA